MLTYKKSKPAIEGGNPVRKDFLPFAIPSIGKGEKEEVLKTLESGWLTTGKKTEEFENRFCSYIGCKHAIALSSCTAGLHLSLLAFGIRPGDEVITTPLTFAATGNTICMVGAKSVFADIGSDNYNIDPEKIEEKLTKKTRGIIAVHICGLACDLKLIREIGEKNGIPVIEDAAHAIGSSFTGGGRKGSHPKTTLKPVRTSRYPCIDW